MNTNTVDSIYLSRQDLSDYVFHFTSGANASDVLVKILADRSIKDIKSKGFICFTEAPLLMLPDMFDIFSHYQEPMYAPYGIGIHRDVLYKMGGRPVIYGTEEDKAQISETLYWRFVMMKPGEYDFSWLREWRLPRNEYVLSEHDIVVVSSVKEEESILFDLEDVEVDAETSDGGYTTYYTGKFVRLYKGISLERIKNMNLDSKDKLRKDLSEQAAEEMIPLGSSWS